MKLQQALGRHPRDVVAFIGAGGKTSALINLGHELTQLGWRVLATTTTSVRAEELELMPWALTPGEGPRHAIAGAGRGPAWCFFTTASRAAT